MHLCLVTLDLAPVRTSGLAVYAERIAHPLSNSGHDVTVIAALRPGTSKREELGLLRVYRVPIGRSDWIAYSWNAAQCIRRLNRDQQFDVVHFVDVHFGWAYRGPFVASLHQSFRQRLVADDGRPYGSSWRNRTFRSLYYRLARQLFERQTLHRADMNIAVSCATRDEFVQHYALRPERVTVIPEAVDTSYFLPHRTAKLRRELGLEGARVLVYLGFSTPRKGLEYLAAGLHLLPPDVRLIIVGSWERGYREKVMASAGASWERVLEVGSVTDEEVPHYLALADVFVLPSLLEGFGIPLLEAMACGTPIVSTTVGSIPEVVGPCGILVPPRDTKALVAALVELLDDPVRRHELGRLARARATSMFTIEQANVSLIQLYESHVHPLEPHTSR